MGAGASLENPPANDAELNRYFCHACRRIFAMSTPPAGLNCPYCQSSFLEEFGPRGSGTGRINARDLRIGLSDEQARRLNNAATLLQILEAQLREELNNLQHAFNEAEARRSKPLTRTMLDNLKSVNITVDMMCDQPSCPICSEDYSVGEVVTKLPCTHVYHRPCVMPWLEMKRTCPICRFELTDTIPSVQDLSKLSETDLIHRLATFNIIEAAGAKTSLELASSLHDALVKQRQEQDEAETQAAEDEEWRLALEEERAADEALRRQALLARGIDPDTVPPGGADDEEGAYPLSPRAAAAAAGGLGVGAMGIGGVRRISQGGLAGGISGGSQQHHHHHHAFHVSSNIGVTTSIRRAADNRINHNNDNNNDNDNDRNNNNNGGGGGDREESKWDDEGRRRSNSNNNDTVRAVYNYSDSITRNGNSWHTPRSQNRSDNHPTSQQHHHLSHRHREEGSDGEEGKNSSDTNNRNDNNDNNNGRGRIRREIDSDDDDDNDANLMIPAFVLHMMQQSLRDMSPRDIHGMIGRAERPDIDMTTMMTISPRGRADQQLRAAIQRNSMDRSSANASRRSSGGPSSVLGGNAAGSIPAHLSSRNRSVDAGVDDESPSLARRLSRGGYVNNESHRASQMTARRASQRSDRGRGCEDRKENEKEADSDDDDDDLD